MIERYSLPEMDAIFSDVARFSRYLAIELHALDGQAAIGLVPQVVAAACRARAPQVDESFVRAVAERETVTNHDVADALTKQGYKVDKAQVRMPTGPLKTTGEHPLAVSLHTDVVVDITVVVVGEHV